jgi:hypothetical protein
MGVSWNGDINQWMVYGKSKIEMDDSHMGILDQAHVLDENEAWVPKSRCGVGNIGFCGRFSQLHFWGVQHKFKFFGPILQTIWEHKTHKTPVFFGE